MANAGVNPDQFLEDTQKQGDLPSPDLVLRLNKVL